MGMKPFWMHTAAAFLGASFVSDFDCLAKVLFGSETGAAEV
jgi:hypothetical protein